MQAPLVILVKGLLLRNILDTDFAPIIGDKAGVREKQSFIPRSKWTTTEVVDIRSPSTIRARSGAGRGTRYPKRVSNRRGGQGKLQLFAQRRQVTLASINMRFYDRRGDPAPARKSFTLSQDPGELLPLFLRCQVQ